MALKIGDRVRENTSSTGVGGLSLTGAPAGFQRFSAILASGDITYYSLEENDKFEVGIGTYGSNNLERTTVLSSSNSGNKIELGGSGVVFITYPASRAIFSSETGQFVLGASGLLFANGTNVKEGKLVELADVSLSGTPVQNSVFDLNITNKSLSIGDQTRPTNSNNILIGYGAGSGITSGSDSVIIGAESSTINKTGQHNVHIGAKAGPVVSDAASSVYNSVAVGYSAGNKMRHESVAIGYEAALHAYEIGFVGIGYQVGSGLGSYSTVVGYQAGRTLGEDYAVALGYQAGYNGAGESVIWIGQGAGHSSTGSAKSIGIGKNAGKSSSGAECIYIGESAGLSNSSSNLLFIGNGSPAANDTLIKGDMDAKRIAIGVADVTLDDTLFVGVNSANDEGIVVKAAVSQVSNLTSWKNSSDSVLASVSKDGVVSAHEIVATGNGIQIASLVPASTTNKLYNSAGSLYFNGSQVSAPSGVPSGIAFFGLDKAIAQDSNIVYDSGNQRINLGSGGLKFSDGTIQTTADNDTYVSGIAVYSSGQTISNQSNITALLVASGTATSLISSSGIANYASGQAVSNQANITTNTNNITYVSGVATNKFTVTAADSSNYTIDGMGLNSAIDPSIYLHKGHTYYFDKQTSSHPFRVSTSNGGAAYQDADGNSIEISGQGTLKFEVPQNAPDKLYYYCTSHASMNGVIYTTNNVDEIIHVSGIAAYASGQAITNQSNITALNTASGIATSLLAVSGTATSLVATSGIATYASGQAVSNQSNITALLTASGTATSLIASSGIASYASGQAIANESDIVAVSGIAAYASGTSGAGGSITVKEADGSPNVGNVTTIVVSNGTLTDNGGGQVTVTTGGSGGGGDVTTSQLNYVSGIAVYGSGQSILNQSNITALSTASGIATSLLAVSGTATSLVATSGIATYASGNTANISFGSNAEGDLLYHNGTSFIRLPKGTDDYILKMNGNVPNWEADSGGSSLSAGSGVFVDGASKINVYGGSGNFQELQVTSDNVFVPKVVFTGSGAVDTPITLETRSSYESVSGSGSALLFQGTQGQLFSITDNLSSGVIFSVADIAGLPLIEADASGDVKLGEFGRYVGVGSGVPEYGLDISASGRIQKGIVLSSYMPAVTTNTLYNEGGTLKFNGSSIGGGGVDTYTSGVATYASGQAISNQSSITSLLSASGTATSLIASSGIASYASGQAISNQGNIIALLSASGTATSLIASSGIATYASGQAIANESDILATSGIAAYASGLNNYLLNPSGVGGISITSDADFVIFSGDATLARSSELNYVSGVAVYASGQITPALTAGSGITIDGADKINVHGGSGHFINLAVDGAFSATTKSFLIDHPTKDGMKLQYGSLEGPENGVYIRGTSGSNVITLPEYWSTLVDQSTVTVTLTSIGYYQPLFIKEKGKNYIKVGGCKGSYDYVVYGERKDVEKLKVEW